MRLRGLALGFALVLAISGCGARAWKQALNLDEPAAYHRFLREHGQSRYAADARRRLEVARLRDDPSYENFLAFQQRYPGDALVAEVQTLVEAAGFEAARAIGSGAAYRAFLANFPDSDQARRAEGNAAYLEASGFIAASLALAGFAEEYPESDYAAEARRSLELAESARRSVAPVGMVIDLGSSLPDRDQLRRDFGERARLAWQRVGVEVVEVRSDADLAHRGLPARLRISHREDAVPASTRAGVMSPSGVLAQTQVVLEHEDTVEPVWERSFEVRARASRRRLDSSVLYSPGARAYWEDFFVPVASWHTRRAIRAPLQLGALPVSVDLEGSRAAVLFGDGSFEIHDIGDPASPSRIGQYRRPRDLASFHGIQLRGQRVVVYGADGIEVLMLGPDGATRELQIGREVLGAVRGVEFLEDSAVAATTRGLLEISREGGLRVWMEGPMRGVVRRGDYLIFGDETRLLSARPEKLAEGRVEGSLELPRGLEVEEFRAEGARLVLLGRRGVLWVDVEDPARPRLAARIDARESGRVSDAADFGNRLLLLGDRGLQVADAADERLAESLDVRARRRFSIWGRHAALVGDGLLQVVDLTPFLAAYEVAETPLSSQRVDSSR